MNGLRDQVEDAALLINLNDPSTLSDCLLKLLKNKKLRNDLMKKGFKIASRNNNHDRISSLEDILISFINKYTNFKIKD